MMLIIIIIIIIIIIHMHIILSDNSLYCFTQTVSLDGIQRRDCRCYSLLWVGVHAVLSSVQQLMLCFCSPYLKKTPGIFSFSPYTGITTNKHVVCCRQKFYTVSEPTGSD
jgi:hypothetical protein